MNGAPELKARTLVVMGTEYVGTDARSNVIADASIVDSYSAKCSTQTHAFGLGRAEGFHAAVDSYRA